MSIKIKRKSLKFTYLSLFVFLGFALSGSMAIWASDRYEDLKVFSKVLNLVQRFYVSEVETKKLIVGGIKGMLKELDPHTNYLPEEIFKEFESETNGNFGGLGIEITIKKGVLTIISPIEDAPAWKAGIKAGDKIISIDGESTKGMSLVEAAQKMRGDRGTNINLGIYRDGFKEPKDFIVKRGEVKIKSVKYQDLEKGFGYIKITSFIADTSRDVKKYLKQIQNANKEIKGLVLDLRHNPGGLLDQAKQVSDLFLESGIIVSTKGRTDSEVFYAKKTDTYLGFPIVVLIDEFSASASEIVAGALQDNKRALIMGKKSFGKGSVQSVISLGPGTGGLKLTVARYFTPSGRSIQAEGISPDVEVENFDAELLEKAVIKNRIRKEKDMKGHLLSKKEKEAKEIKSQVGLDMWWSANNKSKEKLSDKDLLFAKDFQARQAYNYLKAWKVMSGFPTMKE